MSRLTIVIPCLGGAAEFDGTLVSVLQNRPADCEVLVVHTEPYSDPYELGNEVRFIEIKSHSLVEVLNTALAEAGGDVLHFLACGLEASEQWTEPALKHFDDADVAAVSPLILQSDRRAVAAAGVRWSLGGARRVVTDRRVASPGSGRLRATILGPTLAAAYYRRDVLSAIGGFDLDLGDALADVAVALAIQALGKLHVCEPASELVRFCDPPHGTYSGFIDGRAAERLFWRYRAGRGGASAMGLHPFSIAGDAICQVPEFSSVTSLLGRAAACFEIGSVQRHQRHLAAAEDRLADLAKLRAAVRPTSKPRSTTVIPSSPSAARRRAA